MPGNDSFTSLLMHCNESLDLNQTFTDYSQNGHTISVSRIDETQLKTSGSIKKFGAASAYIKNSGSNHLDVTNDGSFSFGTDPFVVDLWVRTDARDNGTLVITVGNLITMLNVNRMYTRRGGVDIANNGDYPVPLNSFFHCAWVREDADYMAFYQNGTRAWRTTNNVSGYSFGGNVKIGGGGGNSTDMYFDEIRISKGTNRGWTGSTIDVPTSQYSGWKVSGTLNEDATVRVYRSSNGELLKSESKSAGAYEVAGLDFQEVDVAAIRPNGETLSYGDVTAVAE